MPSQPDSELLVGRHLFGASLPLLSHTRQEHPMELRDAIGPMQDMIDNVWEKEFYLAKSTKTNGIIRLSAPGFKFQMPEGPRLAGIRIEPLATGPQRRPRMNLGLPDEAGTRATRGTVAGAIMPLRR